MRIIKINLLAIVLLFGIYPMQAITYISQHIEKDTKWLKANSPYVISNDLAIFKEATLEIEAGTRVFFSKETKLIIAGNLIAQGDKKQKIYFAGQNGGDWNGFLFTKECNDYNPQTKKGCQFDHCVFEGTGETPAQLIRTKGCNISITNSTISDCYTAIQTERQAEIWVRESKFDNCNRVLNVRNTSLATIEQNEMNGCNSIMLGGTTTFRGNKLQNFSGKGRHSGVVVWMLGGGVVNIQNNEFNNFESCVIKLYKMTRRSSFLVQSNDFKNNTTNLDLAGYYYNKGKSMIEQNNFHNCKKYQVIVSSDHTEKELQTIVIGANYWGKVSAEDLQKLTLDNQTDQTITGKVSYSELLKKSLSF